MLSHTFANTKVKNLQILANLRRENTWYFKLYFFNYNKIHIFSQTH